MRPRRFTARGHPQQGQRRRAWGGYQHGWRWSCRRARYFASGNANTTCPGIGRFLRNVVSGFALVGIAGSIVSSIVSFSQGYAAGGFLWLLMAVLLLVMRIWLPRVIPPQIGQ